MNFVADLKLLYQRVDFKMPRGNQCKVVMIFLTKQLPFLIYFHDMFKKIKHSKLSIAN